MPVYGHKHDDNYKGYSNFKKKVLEPIIIIGAFGAVIYVSLLHDTTENKKNLQGQSHGSLEHIVK